MTLDNKDNALTKSIIRQSVILVLSQNKLGFNFIKSNYRYYYFERNSKINGVRDIMVIAVYIKARQIGCNIKSLYSKHSLKQFNSRDTLLNTCTSVRISETFDGPDFDNNTNSFNNTLEKLLSSINIQGDSILKKNKDRFENPSLIFGLDYIKKLEVSKNLLKDELYGKGAKPYNFPKFNYLHPIFKDLVQKLEEIEKTNDWYNYLAQEILHYYIFD